MPMDIHITRNGEQHGPYPEATARQMLEAGQLLPTDLAWHAGSDGWKPLSEVLGAAAQPPATPPSPPAGGILKRTMAGAAPAEGKSEDSEGGDPDQIRVTRKGEPIGPYSREKAKEYFASGQLLPTDWGWHDGMDEWKPLYEVLGMEVPAQAAFAPAAATGKPGKGKKVALIIGIVVLVAGLAAAGYFFFYPMLKGDGEGDGSGGGENGGAGEVTKELSAEEKKVVGEYELIMRAPVVGDGGSNKWVLRENGVAENYTASIKTSEAKWSIVNGEIHVEYDSGVIVIFRINTNKSITGIAGIRDGKRTDIPNARQFTYKKSNS
jgi:hypothetical protein